MKKELLFIFLLNAILFFSLIFIHEISHVGIAMVMGCKIKALLFDLKNGYAYTELLCSKENFLIYLTGFFPSIFLASFLFLKPIRNFFFLVTGFSFIQGSLDLSILLNSSYFYLYLLFGLFLISIGEYKIASSFIEVKTIYFENENFN